VNCDGADLLQHATIGERPATEAQRCLLHVALDRMAFACRMTSPGDPNFKGLVLATASKDERGEDWKALIYAADQNGKELIYVGTHEMTAFLERRREIERLKRLLEELQQQKTGRPIRVPKPKPERPRVRSRSPRA